MTSAEFDEWTEAYEAMINWPQRLERELPFFRRWVADVAAESVLDAACGTGHHAAALHSEGLRVEAADVSPAMIERARAMFGTPSRLEWIVRSFEDSSPNQPFDVVICIGNSLSLCPDVDAVQRAVTTMMAATRQAGVVILQIINLDRFPAGPCVWQKHLTAKIQGRQVLINKGIHRCGHRGYVDMVVSPVDDPTLTRHQSIPLLGLGVDVLQRLLQRAGASSIEAFGDYAQQPFSPEHSGDLILVAHK
jgi:SAM-dependent methyltransferase